MTDMDQSRTDSDAEKECSDDSDVEIDPAEFDRRMEQNLRRIILAECQFLKVKTRLKDAKTEQLAKRKQETLDEDGTTKTATTELGAKNLEAYNDFEERNKMSSIVLGLEQDTLERKVVGERQIVCNNQSDNMVIAQDQLIDELINEISSSDSKLLSADIVAEHLCGEQKADSFKRRYLEFDYAELEAKKRNLGFPLIVYELTEDQIEEDLRRVDLALLIAEKSK